MDYETPLTIEGRTRLRKAVVEYESWGYETRTEALRSELGAKTLSKGHVYTLPCIHEGRRHVESGRKKTYVLKVCSSCAGDGFTDLTSHWDRTETSSCFLDLELGVWNTAVDCGDADLLCPILDADRRQGWMLMEYCDELSALPDDHPYEDLEVLNSYHADQCIAHRLRDRGWLPESADKMDVEAFVLDGRLVAVDYKAIYHIDWMYDPLSWRRSQHLRRDTPHTAAAVLASDEWDAEVRGAPGPSPKRRRIVEQMHYSRTKTRREINAEITKALRNARRHRMRNQSRRSM